MSSVRTLLFDCCFSLIFPWHNQIRLLWLDLPRRAPSPSHPSAFPFDWTDSFMMVHDFKTTCSVYSVNKAHCSRLSMLVPLGAQWKSSSTLIFQQLLNKGMDLYVLSHILNFMIHDIRTVTNYCVMFTGFGFQDELVGKIPNNLITILL